jgi:hypothetical protein
MKRHVLLLVRAFAVLAVLASSGCAMDGDAGRAPSGDPDTGGRASSDGAEGGISDSADGNSQYANFATMSEIVTYRCGGSGCHGGETQPTMVGLDDGKLYSTLTTYVSKLCGNRLLVKPGSPQSSAFYLAQSGLCGAGDGGGLPQMPLGCVDNCIPPDYREGVREWIARGAPMQ